MTSLKFMPYNAQSQYQIKKQRVIKSAKALIAAGHKLSLKKKTSNLFRNRRFTKQGIDVTDFGHVINVDTETMLIEAEGMTPFETLVDAALEHGCLPAVVPELKSITVGGGFTGVAIESSSFIYGLVHETITEADILLANGEVVTATRDNQYQDLFFGFPNTYGSLGYALRIKMKLIKAKPYVKLTHLHFKDANTYFSELNRLCQENRSSGKITYIDGTVYSEHDLHITLGEFTDQAPYTSNYKFMKIFYQSIKQRDEDYLTAKDYIWRWDTDWFWCSKNFGMHNKVLRFIVGKFLLKSTRYWKVMYLARNNKLIKWLESLWSKPAETVIQDIEVPIDQAERFHQFFHKHIGIKPVWICPVQTADTNNHFSFYDLDASKLFVNFGFWDTVPSTKEAGHYNRLIEKEVLACQGHKSLYSDVYYTEAEFWKMYNQSHYNQLKKKYDPQNGLREWFDKISR